MEWAPFDSVDATSLRWLSRSEQPRVFELLAGEQPLATLSWKAGSGSLTEVQTSQGTWTLKRIGFLNPTITVRKAGGTENIARLSVHWRSHRIEVAGGPSYRFHRAGLLVPAWQVTTEDGHEVLHIEPVREDRKLVAGAVVAPAAASRLPEFALLAVISWYFIVLAWFEDEALVPFEGPDAPPTPAGEAP
jgi:hypothetical protein